MKKLIIEIIERVRLLTGKIVEYKESELHNGTILSIDDDYFLLTPSDEVKYIQVAKLYDIDIVTDFSNVIIKKFKLKTI